MNTENIYKVSAHAKERYTERIMGKVDKLEINRFIEANENKIVTDINNMIKYGEMIYAGRQSQKDGKGKVLNVYLRDCWVVLVDEMISKVVTLYKIDLGCGDDFNLMYISKMMDKINECKNSLSTAQLEVSSESIVYQNLIDDAQAQINEYKSYIKNLEEMIKGYQLIIDNNRVKVSQSDRDVAEIVNKLVGKREF